MKLFFLVILLAFLPVSGSAQELKQDNEAVAAAAKTIEGALSSDWVTVEQDALKDYLSQFFTGELLEEIYQDALEARSYPTEWVEEVEVKNVSVIASGKGWQLVKAGLIVTPGEILEGKGYFLLEGDPGRISKVEYIWE